MEIKDFKAMILVIIIASGVVITSGCIETEDIMGGLENVYNNKAKNAGINSSFYDEDETSQNQTQHNNTQETDQNQQTTTQKSTQTKTTQTTSTKSSTPTKTTTQTPTTPKACSHVWTTQYVGFDSAKDKIKYKVYCSKCGEFANYVWY